MNRASSLRDLVRTNSSSEPNQQEYVRLDEFGRTVQQAARETTPLLLTRNDGEEAAGSGLPGDPVDLPSNRFLSMNPQGVARLLRSGQLSRADEDLARQAMVVYGAYSGGEQVMWTQAPPPDVEKPVGTYAGAGCVTPDMGYVEEKRLPMRKEGGAPPRAGSAPYQGAAERLPEHELEYLWR